MARRILIVDEDSDHLDSLGHIFSNAGFESATATTGEGALSKLRTLRIDLVVLDLLLPDISGSETCLRIRRDSPNRNVPILVLSALRDERDRLAAFEAGVDDYVTKPYSTRELLCRCEALLRRSHPTPGSPVQGHQASRCASIWVDVLGHRVFVQGREVFLTLLEFKLLTTLMDREGRVQSRAVLLRDVWEKEDSLSARTVDTHIQRLRKKLGPAGAQIATVRGVGYRFTPHHR